METFVRDMEMKIQQTPQVRLLVSVALLEKLVFGSGFEIAGNPALCFQFLARRRRRFRVPWLPPPLAETSEGVLYLRTKAGRAARM
jgi:hypothetical protein